VRASCGPIIRSFHNAQVITEIALTETFRFSKLYAFYEKKESMSGPPQALQHIRRA
jgi:hypothetical protein